MITVCLRYDLDPYKVKEFEAYARAYMPVVQRLGGMHHGIFLPEEGQGSSAYVLVTFPSLGSYEEFQLRSARDPGAKAADEGMREGGFVYGVTREFLRPVLPARDGRGGDKKVRAVAAKKN